jgi:hypothetical protein
MQTTTKSVQLKPSAKYLTRSENPQCNAMQCNAMQCNAIQCNTIQCNANRCTAAVGRKWEGGGKEVGGKWEGLPQRGRARALSCALGVIDPQPRQA